MSNDSATQQKVIALDVGERRIGVAYADTAVRLPAVYGTVTITDSPIEQLRAVVSELQPDLIVIGYPRNQQGEATQQTQAVTVLAQNLEVLGIPIAFQDESLTSVLAEK